MENATSYGCFHVTDTCGRTLGLRSRRDPTVWNWPGGDVERGEDPFTCAAREYREELGFGLEVLHPGLVEQPRLLAVTFTGPGPRWPRVKIGFIFDGGTLAGDQLNAVTLQPEEHTEWRTHTVEGWRPLLTEGAHNRLAQVDAALRTATTVYLPG
ncbi:NUDIX domain-containing protein [Kitasatospora sp. NPDC008115]|uniref:NUDIX domain-containing protein n=1 Tax=Kitasatospora sp. NPDC008115 TaxID=3364022 RepID=UPI0036EE0A4E